MFVIILCIVFFFFKQKTAYEVRISDWSSDVCSSDLSLRTAITIRAIIQHRNRYTTSVRGVTKSDREWTRKGAGLTPRRRQNELRFGFTLRAPKTQCACWRSVQQGVAIDRSSDQADDPYRGSSRQPLRHRQSNERCRFR